MERIDSSVLSTLRTPPHRGMRFAVLKVAALALFVSACDSARIISEDTRPADANKLYPISAEVQTASLDVAAARSGALGSEAFLDVTRFVREYRRDGRSMLEIEAPRYASRTVDSIRHVAERNGVPSSRVRVVNRGDGIAGVRLKYERIASISSECGDWSESVTSRPETGPYKNFGCATQRNLANMVVHPTDLMFPQVEAPRQSDNRSKPYRDFSTGAVPGAALPSSQRQ